MYKTNAVDNVLSIVTKPEIKYKMKETNNCLKCIESGNK